MEVFYYLLNFEKNHERLSLIFFLFFVFKRIENKKTAEENWHLEPLTMPKQMFTGNAFSF